MTMLRAGTGLVNPGLGENQGIVSDRQVVGKSGLTTKHHAMADF